MRSLVQFFVTKCGPLGALLLAGPVTGLLGMLLVRSFSRREYWQSGVYALGLVEFWLGAPYLAAHLNHQLMSFLQ
jgi:hypothetical protein